MRGGFVGVGGFFLAMSGIYEVYPIFEIFVLPPRGVQTELEEPIPS